MSEEPKLKPCPFCGLDGDAMDWRGGSEELIEHPNNDCVLADLKCYDTEQWNKRVGEAELEAEVRRYKDRARHTPMLVQLLEATKAELEEANVTADELAEAIRKHKDQFRDEALQGEYNLWVALAKYDKEAHDRP